MPLAVSLLGIAAAEDHPRAQVTGVDNLGGGGGFKKKLNKAYYDLNEKEHMNVVSLKLLPLGRQKKEE